MNSYALDPSRIAPSRSDANSNGHFPLASGGGQGGTPRGFSLANMPYLGHHGGMPGGFPAPGMPFVGAPGHWAGNMPGAGEGPGGLHQPGVMRRGHNRNRAGPYDRRRPNGNGRLSPVRMSNMYGAGGRPPAGMMVPPGHPAANMLTGNPFPDAMGAGGAQAIPPREAVQGRSLKSYEDLDAVGGSGSGELNY